MRAIAPLLAVLLIPVASVAPAEGVAGLHDAVTRALANLAQRNLAWKEEHNCASCHHAPLMLWSAYAAKAKGYAVDESAVETVRAWIFAEDNAARILPNADTPPDRNIFAVSSAYTVLAMAAAPTAAGNATTLAHFRDHYTSHQEADGAFLINGTFSGTAPILEAGSTGTVMARLALGALPGLSPEQEATAARADSWLATHPPAERSQQELALRLVLAARAHDAAATQALAAALLALQHPSGGWCQIPEREPDAYATGQALLALGTAGMRTTELPVADGVAFLLRTQNPAGDWTMTSRTVAPDGSGAKNLEPITAAAAAWATLGLVAVE